MNTTGTFWWPYGEWSIENAPYSGNPFDVLASATFTHTASGEQRIRRMLYDGDTTWEFRFTGTHTRAWIFTTASEDPRLDGHSGTVTINANPDPDVYGFMTQVGNKWDQPHFDGALEAVAVDALAG